MLAGKRILQIIGGYGADPDPSALVMALRGKGAIVHMLPTAGACSPGDEAPDLILVMPATADLLADLASGRAHDAATTLVLSARVPVLVVPALADALRDHPAIQRNLARVASDGARILLPSEGTSAGSTGPEEVVEAVAAALGAGPLAGRHVLLTSGPTHEPIDPVRYIANRSSGAQGTALARALVALGARVTFVSGPAQVPPPAGVELVRVETACEMREAVIAALPADAAVFAAAVADWRVVNASGSKMKKDGSGRAPALEFAENPDILALVSRGPDRPRLVVGFAAETDDVLANATAKRLRKGCDWIVANDVSAATGIMGGTENAVTIISESGAETWERMGKDAVAARLATKIAEALS